METRLNNFVVLYVYIVIQKCILDLRKKNNKVERMKRKSIQNIYELENYFYLLNLGLKFFRTKGGDLCMGKKSSFQKAKQMLSDWNKSPLVDMMSPTRIEFKSNKEVIVEGCKSIDQYDENMVKIKVTKMTILFFGRNLELKCMTSDSLVIYGFITSVEFVT